MDGTAVLYCSERAIHRIDMFHRVKGFHIQYWEGTYRGSGGVISTVARSLILDPRLVPPMVAPEYETECQSAR